jgi:hypothetical protein
VSLTGYSYPWDYVGDESAFDRVASLELDVVALAASYHATRLATPFHPTRRVTEIENSAAYFPLRDDVWKSRRLRPRTPGQWIGTHAFVDAATRLTDRGIGVDGWIVLTHVDLRDSDTLDLTVRNAFGETYPYALCPSYEEVRDYCRALVSETLRSAPLRGVVLEACGPMGVEHSGVHDKMDMAQWGLVERQLLSVCFCRACADGMRNEGIDPEELARTVREALTRSTSTMEDALGEMCAATAAFHLLRSTNLQLELIEAVRDVSGDASITLHASATPWTTGSFAATTSDALALVNSAVANCWDEGHAEREIADLGRMTTSLGAYLRLDHEWSAGEGILSHYAEIGVHELHLYHLGLLSATSLDTVQRLVSTWRRSGDSRLDQIEESLSDG